MMAASKAPTVRQWRLGVELRRLREECGLTADEVANRLRWSPSKISRMETAKIGARISDVRQLLELYDVTESHRGELLALAQSARVKGWWAEYPDLGEDFSAFLALEDEADTVQSLENYVVSGLLQTTDYARALMQGWNVIATVPDSWIERRLELRMRRQRLLTAEKPLRLSVILDESALLRCVGNPAVMAGQMQHLAEITRSLDIDLRIRPLDKPLTLAMSESFHILKFSPAYEVDFPDVVHLESATAIQIMKESTAHVYQLTWEHAFAQSLDPASSHDRVLRAAQYWRERQR